MIKAEGKTKKYLAMAALDTEFSSDSEISGAIRSGSKAEREVEDIQSKKQWEWHRSDSESEYVAAYDQEPLADEAWLAKYRKEKEEEERQRTECQQRFEGLVQIDLWYDTVSELFMRIVDDDIYYVYFARILSYSMLI